MRLVTTEQMRQLEESAVAAGTTWAALMEQAGWGVAQEALRCLGEVRGKQVVILVGPGNNGGDGLVSARHLHDAGVQVSLYIWKRSNLDKDSNLKRCRERSIGEVLAADDRDTRQLQRVVSTADMVIDALLGMGTSRPVEGDLAVVVRALNHISSGAPGNNRKPPAKRPFVLAIDVPTGINSDTGAVLGVAVRATTTVATGLPKRGLLLYPGKAHAGEIVLADIGLPARDLEAIMSDTMNATYARPLLPARPVDSHKGTFGKTMVVAGSFLYPGAAALATGGACRVGAGLVTLATARSVLLASGRAAEVTLLPLPEAELGTPGEKAADELLNGIEGYHALLIGPGLGKEEKTSRFLKRVLGIEQPAEVRSRVGFRIHSAEAAAEAQKPKAKEHEKGKETSNGEAHYHLPPTVLDADGLNLLAEIDDWATHLPASHVILTPHPGEMKRLLKAEDLDEDLVQVATDAAQQWQQVVVLKGATTVVAAPDGRSVVHAGGNAALATAGTGDVLSGAIAGLLAQQMPLFDAAALGVYLHAAAGAMLREELGDMGSVASDLLPLLPRAIKQLRGA
jgi:NAD(P)H-hydrate epimerase